VCCVQSTERVRNHHNDGCSHFKGKEYALKAVEKIERDLEELKEEV